MRLLLFPVTHRLACLSECESGKYQSQPGSSTCLRCAAGSAVSAKGQDRCKRWRQKPWCFIHACVRVRQVNHAKQVRLARQLFLLQPAMPLQAPLLTTPACTRARSASRARTVSEALWRAPCALWAATRTRTSSPYVLRVGGRILHPSMTGVELQGLQGRIVDGRERNRLPLHAMRRRSCVRLGYQSNHVTHCLLSRLQANRRLRLGSRHASCASRANCELLSVEPRRFVHFALITARARLGSATARCVLSELTPNSLGNCPALLAVIRVAD